MLYLQNYFPKGCAKVFLGRMTDSLDAISISCWYISTCLLRAEAIQGPCKDFKVGFLSKATRDLGREGRRGECLFICM